MRWVNISIGVTMILVIWSASNIMWSGHHYQGIIKADGKGYYAHLPAIFIYQNLNFPQFDSIENGKYFNENYKYDYRKTYDGHIINKYFAGTSLPVLPFFLGGHLITKISGGDADGYSKWYQIMVSVAGIFYLLLSLIVFVRFLKLFEIPPNIIALSLPVMVFGTNWYYYVVVEPAMSHVYSVFFISLFLYQIARWARRGVFNPVNSGVLVGLILFIRPVNGLILLATPIFFDDFTHFRNEFLALIRKDRRIILAVLFAFLIPALQLVIYKIQCGHFMVYSYEEEGFNFLHPHFFDILFSYKKGLFLYTPLMLISLFGLVPMLTHNRWWSLSLFSFFIILTWVLSSWWNWYYGGSFSSRAYLEYMLIFAWPMAELLKKISGQKRLIKWLFGVAIVLLLLLCQFQTFQYRHMVIHWDSMTQESYWNVFLNFDFLKK
ncbi:MAG: hypothetical protein GC181_05520 [Bacteroidetes bacterium]|nr:hypothetical protein [Bacteroidota bacterium]